MIYEVVMPQLGLTMEEGTVTSWHKKLGDRVKKGEMLFTLETDKAAMEVESTDAGYLNAIVVEIGKTLPVGTLIAILGDHPGETSSGNQSSTETTSASEAIATMTTPTPESSAKAPHLSAEDSSTAPARSLGKFATSPRARFLADELGVDITSLEPQRGQRIVEADVRRFHENQESLARQSPPPSGSSTTRRFIAQRMTDSFQKAPHFYLGVEANAAELMDFRKEQLETSDSSTDQKLTYTDLFLRALSLALKLDPQVNAYWGSDGVQSGDSIDVGFAVQTPGGLVAPIIRKCDQLSLFELVRQRHALTEKARSGKLQPQDLRGGSATLSNLGSYDVDWFQAILNPPQSVILATGKIAPRATVVNGSLRVSPTTILSLSVDHRVLDGVAAATFLGRIKKLIENPAALLL
jgi:pyruvate dehydrogenase E2 component (dihydrolipoamide acetyltransferase)